MNREADKPDFNGPNEYKSPSDFAGQQLFIQGDDWHNNAMLGWTHFPLDTYALGYKDAADGLLYALAERRASLDTVIYPLIFLYRQALELQLKLLLPLARRLADASAKEDHRHELMPMWKELRQHLEVLISDEDDSEYAAMEDFISQLHEADPRSFAFRYPTNMKGEVSLPDLRHVNVRHLSEVMDSIFLMLNGAYSMLGEMDQYDQHAEW
ncbi:MULTISPECIES: hypothetical protein [Pseudomonas]|jgi:hypothetical protein|nr:MULTISPECIES: hypothetical protein [Pseudomonas]KAF0251161.1 hypothetical protein GN299_29910 [Pseudomonas putida]MDD2080753.1 hypothetical protein [Pseudomonas putida]PXZ48152.1 hypothetical protein DM483_18075 [Pseudomonas sp. SMT-1]QDW59208.1 hypothetical protein FFH79_021165 [Pseudomonas sp. KBS0802]QXZ04620.1 hypothetical protein HG554_10010 [Pseudomonas putida]